MNLHLTLKNPGMYDAEITTTTHELRELLKSVNASRYYTRVHIKDEQGKFYYLMRLLESREWLPDCILEELSPTLDTPIEE